MKNELHNQVNPTNVEFQENARIANDNAGKWNHIFPEYKNMEKVLKDWALIMGTSFIIWLCVSNLITGVVEYLVSVPIWREVLKRAPWFGAFAMLIIGGFISHLFSKVVSSDIFDWELYELKRAEPNEDILKLKAKKNSDKWRDFIVGVVLLVGISSFVYYLSVRRVELEHEVDPTRVWNILDWAPVGLFVLNSTFLGIYWWYVIKRFIYNWRLGKLNNQLQEHKDACVYHTEKAYNAYKDIVINKGDLSDLSEDQEQTLTRYRTKHAGDIDYCAFPKETQTQHESVFVILENEKPKKQGIVFAKTIAGKMLNPTTIDDSGMCRFIWKDDEKMGFIVSLCIDNQIINGQWNTHQINKVVIEGGINNNNALLENNSNAPSSAA